MQSQMPAAPVISVVIPFCNSNDILRDTVLSVTGQGGPSCEVIIVDDFSDQDPRDAVEGIEGRIRIHRTPGALGPAAARNAGLMRADGRFVCFLDAGDRYAQGFFRETMRFFEANPEVAAVTTGVELDDCHRYVTQFHHAGLTNSIPSNLIMRADAARLLGGFPEDPAFQGPAGGEDACFKASLSRLITHHAPFPFLRRRVVQGGHSDRFLDTLHLRDGQLIPTAPTPGELDGSIQRAAGAHHARVGARLLAEAETAGRGHPLTYSSFRLAEDYDGLAAQCDAGVGGIHPEEGYALAHWAARAPGQGGVVELGCAQGWATAWLALGCRDSGRGKLTTIEPFVQSDAVLQSHLGALQSRNLAGWVDIVRGLSAPVAKGWGTPIRLLVLGGGSSFMAGEQDLSEWSRHVEPTGAYAFYGVGARQAMTRLYEAAAAAPILREVFSYRSLRILAAR